MRRWAWTSRGSRPPSTAGLADVVGGEVTFRHPLLRAAIYRRQPAGGAAGRARRGGRRRCPTTTSTGGRGTSRSPCGDRMRPSRRCWTAPVPARPRGPRTRWRPRPTSGRPGSVRPSTTSRTRLVAAAENAWAAGLAPRAIALLDELTPTILAPELATSALELRASIAVRTGSVREAAELLERAAGETASADARAVLLAEALHATLFLADGAAAGRLVEPLTGMPWSEATSSRARAIGTVAAGMAKVLAGRGGIEELRAAVPLLAGSAETAGRRPRDVVADVRPAVHPRCRDRARAARAGRRGAGPGGRGDAARTAVPGGARRRDVGLVGPGRGRLHRGDPAGARHRSGHRAGDVAGGSRRGWSRGPGRRRSAGRTPRRRWPCAAAATSTGARRGRCSRSATSSCPWATRPPRWMHLQRLDRSSSSSRWRIPTSRRAPSSWTRCCGSVASSEAVGSRCGVRRGRGREGTALGPGARPPLPGLLADDFDAALRAGAGPARGDAGPLRDRPAPAWRTALGSVAPVAGSTPGCSCAGRSTTSPRSVPRCGPSRRRASST